MYIVPAHGPVVVVSRLREAVFRIIQIILLTRRQIEPAAGPGQLIEVSAPGVVEAVGCSIAGVAPCRIRELVQAYGMLEAESRILGICILEYDRSHSESRSSLTRYCRSGRI